MRYAGTCCERQTIDQGIYILAYTKSYEERAVGPRASVPWGGWLWRCLQVIEWIVVSGPLYEIGRPLVRRGGRLWYLRQYDGPSERGSENAFTYPRRRAIANLRIANTRARRVCHLRGSVDNDAVSILLPGLVSARAAAVVILLLSPCVVIVPTWPLK